MPIHRSPASTRSLLRANNALSWATDALLVLGTLWMCSMLMHSALAHEDGKDPDAAWFRSLSQDGMNCCDSKDCHRTEAWGVNKEGHYIVKVGNEWVVVQDPQVLHIPNPTGMAVECHPDIRGYVQETWIRCFVPGTGV